MAEPIGNPSVAKWRKRKLQECLTVHTFLTFVPSGEQRLPCFLSLQGTELNDDRTPSNASVTTTFNILVIDVNDNAPEFNSSEYSVAIPELAQVGFALPLYIQVQDKDEVRFPLPPLRGSTGWVSGWAGEQSLHGSVPTSPFPSLTAAIALFAVYPQPSFPPQCAGTNAVRIAGPLRARK